MSRLQYLVPELQAAMGLWAVSPSLSQYPVPELWEVSCQANGM